MKEDWGVPQRPVRELMRQNILTVEPSESLREAYQLMRLARLRHLLVTRGDLLLGILSYRDLLERLAPHPGSPEAESRRKTLEGTAVEAAMRAPAEAAGPELAALEAASRMERLRIGCLPVVERRAAGAQLLGLLTESDLLRAAYDPDSRVGRRAASRRRA